MNDPDPNLPADPPADPPVDPPENDDPPSAKVEMTQAELDALIEKRLGRERKKWDSDAKTAADRSKLDEVDRLKAEKADSDKATEDAKREVLGARVEGAAERAATKAGVKADRIDRFMRLVDLSELDELTVDGKPDTDAIAKVIDQALSEVPEFKGTAAPGSSGAEMTGSTGKVWTRAEIAKLSVDEYAKHETEIMAQLTGAGIK